MPGSSSGEVDYFDEFQTLAAQGLDWLDGAHTRSAQASREKLASTRPEAEPRKLKKDMALSLFLKIRGASNPRTTKTISV